MAKSKRNYPVGDDTSSSERPTRESGINTEIDPGYPVVFVCADTQTRQPWIALVPALNIGINTERVGYTDYRDLMNIVHECLYSLSKGITDPRVCAPTVSVKTTGKVMTRQSNMGALWDDLLTSPVVPTTK